VKWADGADLTARDYAFGLEIMKDPQNPLAGAILVVNIAPLVEAIDVVDDKTQGKYASTVDKVQDAAKKAVDKSDPQT